MLPMFDGPLPAEDVRPGLQARRHPVEHRLVFHTRGLAIAVGAARPDRTNQACRPVGVVDFLQIPWLAFIARRKSLSRRTDEYIQLRAAAELILAEKTFAHRRSALRFGNIGRQPRLFAGLNVLDLGPRS